MKLKTWLMALSIKKNRPLALNGYLQMQHAADPQELV